jgi:DNA-binding YbaB/EbfC family protein
MSTVSFDVSKMMRQVQKLQEEMERLQQELASRTVEATAGGGKVRAVVTGDKQLVELVLDKEVVDPSDVEMLQDLIIAAVNEAFRESEEMVTREMSRLAGELGLPNLPGLTPGRSR